MFQIINAKNLEILSSAALSTVLITGVSFRNIWSGPKDAFSCKYEKSFFFTPKQFDKNLTSRVKSNWLVMGK